MERVLIARELAGLLSVLSHPDRVLIIEELRAGEKNVSELTELVGVTSSRISQHLAQLRAHRLVLERREGRRHYYRLAKPAIAAWLIEGLQFLDTEMPAVENIHSAVDKMRKVWGGD